MQLEDCRLPSLLCWVYLSLFLLSVSATETDSECSCRNYGSCVFNLSLPRKQNVAVGKTAKMSSVLRNPISGFTSGPACLAVNGKTNTTFRPINQFPDTPNCIHTADGDREPYWEVDLGQQYSIDSITIYWESAKSDRRHKVRITVDGVLCFDFFSPVSNPSDVLCYSEMTGQAVRLSKNDYTTADDYYITVCEVEVWVCLPGFFGIKCQHACPKPVCENNQVCSAFDGTCPEDPTCACRSYGSCRFNSSLSNKRNVAVGKRAKMSSEYHSLRFDETSGPGCLAVNGKTDTIFRPLNKFPDSPNCIHTGDDDRDPYWEVDLSERFGINSIKIYWRHTEFHDRSNGVKVTVDGQLCHTFRSPVSNPSSITCVTQLAGQTVRLSKNDHKTSVDYFITVCEVEVWVCLPGFFGSECQHVCPEPVCKNNQICSPFDGTCPNESYSSDQTEVPSTPATAAAATSCTPATCDITKLVFPVVGAVLAGSVVIGICMAAVWWLRRSRDRRLGLTAEARGAGGMVTELGDVGRSEVRAQVSGLHGNQTQGDYINMHDVSDVAVQGRKGNKYLPFPTRKSDKSGLCSDLSDDGEYEEMK